MNRLVDGLLDPFLWTLSGWSIRWGVLIAVLAAWLRLRPPRRAATRHLLCAATLAAGSILPLAPRWSVPWPGSAAASTRITAVTAARNPAPIADLPGDHPTAGTIPVGPSRSLEPARAGRLAIGPWPRVGLAAAWLVGVVAVLARLAIGRAALARLRAEARPVAGDDLQGGLREMGSRRAVALATHPAIGSPVTLVGRSPLILVPVDWPGLPATNRRACLLHELAHLGRRDDLTRLVAELARVPFWFHPAVAWLLARLDREAEMACDEAAVGRGIAPRELAALLLAFARRPRRLDPRGLSLGRNALPFLDRGTVAIRIHRLLEDDMSRAMIPTSKFATLRLVTTLATVALAIGGAGAQAVDPPMKSPAPGATQAAARSFSVAVKDAGGRPVEGATVIAKGHGDVPSRDVARTDAGGMARFDREPRPGMSFRATREGFGIANLPMLRPEQVAGPIVLTLPEGRSLVGSVVDDRGRPIAGAEVLVETVHSPPPIPPEAPAIAIFGELTATLDASPLLAARSDRDGEFVLKGVPDGKIVMLRASAEGHASIVFAALEATDRVRAVLAPEARVAGRVLSEVPGVSPAGRQVRIMTWYGGPKDPNSSSIDLATTDGEGRFEARALRAGRTALSLVGVPPDVPWTFRTPSDVALAPGTVTDATIRIVAGVAVEGRVDSADGSPMPRVLVSGSRWRGPRTTGTPVATMTDASGVFRLRLAAGDTFEYFLEPDPGRRTSGTITPTGVVTVPDGVANYSLPTARLAPTPSPDAVRP